LVFWFENKPSGNPALHFVRKKSAKIFLSYFRDASGDLVAKFFSKQSGTAANDSIFAPAKRHFHALCRNLAGCEPANFHSLHRIGCYTVLQALMSHFVLITLLCSVPRKGSFLFYRL
jgi:hypothetical protein